MKFLVALLLVAAASANLVSFVQQIEQNIRVIYNVENNVLDIVSGVAQAIASEIDKIDVKVNATDIALGLNQQFNLVSDANAMDCAENFLPTLENLEQVLGALENFQLGLTFESINPLISALKGFQSTCKPVYDSYNNYFALAAETYQNDQKAFFQQVVSSLKSNENMSIVYLVNVITDIINNTDTSAGENVADIVNIALKAYTPSN